MEIGKEEKGDIPSVSGVGGAGWRSVAALLQRYGVWTPDWVEISSGAVFFFNIKLIIEKDKFINNRTLLTCENPPMAG